jgi:ubiquinone/menaquinone biosynthesis C-methylase UbiE
MKLPRLPLSHVLLLYLLSLFSDLVPAQSKLEDWDERRLNERQPPVKVMNAIGLKPGMVIADIGCGWGRYTVWFADRVGENGKVYAVDIDERALIRLKNRIKKHKFNNVEVIKNKINDPMLPNGKSDIAFIINTYHHLDKPIELVKNIAAGLKPKGTLIIVECDPKKAPIMIGHSTSPKKLIADLDKAGYKLEKIDPFLKDDNIYFFKVKK